jgi:hypothetical protein
MSKVFWKEKSGYRSLHSVNASWWLCAPINIKFNNYGAGHFGFEFLFIGFNKYYKGWSFRLFNKKLVWVG